MGIFYGFIMFEENAKTGNSVNNELCFYPVSSIDLLPPRTGNG
jgi:hypothetical protein